MEEIGDGGWRMSRNEEALEREPRVDKGQVTVLARSTNLAAELRLNTSYWAS